MAKSTAFAGLDKHCAVIPAALFFLLAASGTRAVTIDHTRRILGSDVHLVVTIEDGLFKYKSSYISPETRLERKNEYTCRREKFTIPPYVTIDRDEIVFVWSYCRGEDGYDHSGGNLLLASCDEANAVEREFALARNDCRGSAARAPSRTVSPPSPPPQPAVPRVCSDGSPMPANSVCPTINFPSKEERAKQERENQLRESIRRAADEDRKRAAAAAVAERERLQQNFDALNRAFAALLPASAIANAGAPLTADEQLARPQQEDFASLFDHASPQDPADPSLGRVITDPLQEPLNLDSPSHAPLGAWLRSFGRAARRSVDRAADYLSRQGNQMLGGCGKRDATDAASAAENAFNATVCSSILNALPLGTGMAIWGNQNVDRTSAMLDAVEQEIGQ